MLVRVRSRDGDRAFVATALHLRSGDALCVYRVRGLVGRETDKLANSVAHRGVEHVLSSDDVGLDRLHHKNSQDGNCFNAAGWKMKSTLLSTSSTLDAC